jgi:hypothetical protein
LGGLVQVLDVDPRTEPPGLIDFLNLAHLWFKGHIVGRVVIMVEDKPSSLLCQEDFYFCIIHSIRILEPGEVLSYQFGLIGERQGRSVII